MWQSANFFLLLFTSWPAHLDWNVIVRFICENLLIKTFDKCHMYNECIDLSEIQNDRMLLNFTSHFNWGVVREFILFLGFRFSTMGFGDFFGNFLNIHKQMKRKHHNSLYWFTICFPFSDRSDKWTFIHFRLCYRFYRDISDTCTFTQFTQFTKSCSLLTVCWM